MENERTLWIVTCNLYTDGDWHFDKEMFKNYTSLYFENELYEYTRGDSDGYCLEFRRVFDDMNDAVAFIQKFKDGIGGSRPYAYEPILESIDDVIQEVWSHSHGYRSYDGNSTFVLDVYWIETTAKKIKSIIYED